MNVLKKLDQMFEEYACILLFSLMLLIVSAQVLSRFIFNFSLGWTEELARFTFIWLVYMAISLATKHNRHIKIEVVQNFISKKTGNIITHFTDLCWLGFNIYMIFYGSEMVNSLMNSIQTSAVTGINMGYLYLIIPFGFALMSLRVIQNMWKRKITFPTRQTQPSQTDNLHNSI